MSTGTYIYEGGISLFGWYAILSLVVWFAFAIAVMENDGISGGQRFGWILLSAFVLPIAVAVYLIVSPGKQA